jgi:Acetohydroxy acid isomeroreductase, NADPH-binding domain
MLTMLTEREDWPREKLLVRRPFVDYFLCLPLSDTQVKEYFKNDTLALIGYGSQGHGQGLNLRDNGLNVIIGVRKNGASWKEAVQDGWIPGTNLFDVDEAISRGSIIMNLLSDAAQSETWPAIKPQLTKDKVRKNEFSQFKEKLIDSRPSTSPMASPPSSKTSPKLTCQTTSTLSSSHPKALGGPFEPCSGRAVASTRRSPSIRM